MIQFKSDGRYKYHNRGLHYIVEFRWNSRDERLQFSELVKFFKELYGPEREQVLNSAGTYMIWKNNPDWQYEQNMKAKRRRIYLKEESVLSLALLKVGNAQS